MAMRFDDRWLWDFWFAQAKDGDEALFQLPRTDSFLRAFAKMAYIADQALHDLLKEMERVAKQRKLVTNT